LIDEWDGDRWEVHMNEEEKRGGEERRRRRAERGKLLEEISARWLSVGMRTNERR